MKPAQQEVRRGSRRDAVTMFAASAALKKPTGYSSWIAVDSTAAVASAPEADGKALGQYSMHGTRSKDVRPQGDALGAATGEIMRSILVITLLFILILLAFSQVWVPKVMGWDQSVITDSATAPALPASR